MPAPAAVLPAASTGNAFSASAQAESEARAAPAKSVAKASGRLFMFAESFP
jgi:hypothetical protein